MEKVTGIGGVFFKSKDPKALQAWYAERLGVPVHADGAVVFEWEDPAHPTRKGQTVFAPFAADTKYFEPSSAPFMINFRVRDLDAMLAQLRAAGATVDEKIEASEYGRFGWAMDPDGNRIELWEPPGQR
ncbi:MAG: Glyoxalase/Bleomycin resistance protein/Dioxygenase family protein [Myxococcales bacterium]|nr:Glyoxalase/Bleomycin resistance protein/Dioxygenase family protein [Myxococcales bacterium]